MLYKTFKSYQLYKPFPGSCISVFLRHSLSDFSFQWSALSSCSLLFWTTQLWLCFFWLTWEFFWGQQTQTVEKKLITTFLGERIIEEEEEAVILRSRSLRMCCSEWNPVCNDWTAFPSSVSPPGLARHPQHPVQFTFWIHIFYCYSFCGYFFPWPGQIQKKTLVNGRLKSLGEYSVHPEIFRVRMKKLSRVFKMKTGAKSPLVTRNSKVMCLCYTSMYPIGFHI